MANPKTKTQVQNEAFDQALESMQPQAAPIATPEAAPIATPESLTTAAQKSLEDLYFSAAGIARDALEGYLVENERHDIIDREISFDILDVQRFENHKAPFGTIDGFNVKVLIDLHNLGEKKVRTLSFVANKYRDAFFGVIRDGCVKAQGEPIGPWGLRWIHNAQGQETYDVRPYHMLHDSEEVS